MSVQREGPRPTAPAKNTLGSEKSDAHLLLVSKLCDEARHGVAGYSILEWNTAKHDVV